MDISLLVTTYNRDWLLERSLPRVATLTPPTELIVVDDGSDDKTQDVVERFAATAPFPVRYIYTHNPQKSLCSHARNVGLKAAECDWIVTMEPELCFRTDVLAQFACLHPEHPREVISAGLIWFAPKEFRPATVSQPPKGAKKAVGWVAPYTALWRRSWLMDLGGWDEGFPGPWGWDDIDLLTRLRFVGYGQYIALDVEAIHLHHGLGGDHNFMNEKYFFAKSFNHDHEKHVCGSSCRARKDADLVANEGTEWGIPKPRP